MVIERSALSPWESGQDHVALYLYNGNEYLEALMGAFKARAVGVKAPVTGGVYHQPSTVGSGGSGPILLRSSNRTGGGKR